MISLFPRYMTYEAAKEEAEDRAEKAEQKVLPHSQADSGKNTAKKTFTRFGTLFRQGDKANAKEVDPS